MILVISLIALITFPSIARLGGRSFSVHGSAIDQRAESADLPPHSSLTDYHLVWFDDFDGEALDRRKWYPLIDCSGRGNNELQCYTSREKNVRVRNGQLELIAVPEDFGGRNFTSGRVHASGPGWTYGWFEARARLTKGMHLWPAVWLIPTDGAYGPWPRSGEIDIMEARGQNVAEIESTIHYGSSRRDRGKIGSAMIDFPFDFSQEFHVFGFEWTNQSMRWFLDGVLYFQTSTDRFFTDKKGERIYRKKGSPFDQNFKWILNVAVGGVFFPPSVYGRVSRSDAITWPKPVMEVDWVRVFQRRTEHQNQSSISRETQAPTTHTPVPTTTRLPPTSFASTTSSSKHQTPDTPVTAKHAGSTTTSTSTTTAPTTTVADSVSVFTSPSGIGTQVSVEDKDVDQADKKERDRQESHKRREIDKKEKDILKEKNTNEVERDDGADDEDGVNSPAMDQRTRLLDHEYSDYYY